MLKASFAVRSFAVDAVTALERYLTVLRGVADALASEGHPVASGELRRALERSMRALHVLDEELVTIKLVEDFMKGQQVLPS